nr:MAG TPA: hypothetical protein [Caudoviricetes sp.]
MCCRRLTLTMEPASRLLPPGFMTLKMTLLITGL